MGLLLLILLIVLCLGGLPQVGGSWHGYGYAPSGLLGLVVVIIVIVFLLNGRL